MLDWLAHLHWGVVGQIIMVDLLLSGDNAVLIALACRNLPPAQRVKGVLWGTAAAILLRVILIVFAVALLTVPFVKIIGGLLLLIIGVKLMLPENESAHNIQPAERLMTAVKTIIVADFVMSLDNVIGIAGAVQAAAPEHQLLLIIFGLVITIPLLIWGSQWMMKLIHRFPLIIPAGAALLGWIAGGLIVGDPFFKRFDGLTSATAGRVASFIGAVLVILVGSVWKKRSAQRPKSNA